MEGAETYAPCWDAIDAVVCINLDRRKDRWEAFCRTVQGCVPADKIHRESAVEGTQIPGSGEPPWFTEGTSDRAPHWCGTAGCLLSHRNVIRRAKQAGWRNVLIFEDDIEAHVTPEGLEVLHEALRVLKGRKYLLYLGFMGRTVYGHCVLQRGQSALLRVDGVLASHAYLIPQEMYEPLLRAMPQEDRDAWAWVAAHRAVDAFYGNEVDLWHGVRIYAIMPHMYRQSGSKSDILVGKKYTLGDVRVRRLNSIIYGLYRMLHYPYEKIKVLTNSWRTYNRAVHNGFPGYRKKK